MNNILLLKLKLKSGLLTDLQSDTIFGHFCWRLLNSRGKEFLEMFLNHYKNNKPVFSISNSFFIKDNTLFFPQPSKEIEFIRQNGKTEKLISFLENKKNKDLNLISSELLNFFLNGEKEKYNNKIEELRLDRIKLPKFEGDLRVSVEIDRDTFSTKEGQLFSYNPKYLDKNITIGILVKIIDKNLFEDFHCEEIIKDVFKIGFGKKKSSGYGEFEIIDFNNYNEFKEPEDANGFIVLGNYIPSKDDNLTRKYYDFFVKYGKLGEEYALSENPFKRPIVFIKPGSVFGTEKVKDFYGRCTIPGEISSKNEVIQNGIPFSLNCKL
jgi:CRISPR-associated protein Csm4